jgi:hypothetical protein
MDKKTVVLGATPNPDRYAYLAVAQLREKGFTPIPVGVRRGEIEGIEIVQGTPELDEVHTVTLYLNPERQQDYYNYILGLKPQRIIFNPGTENTELARKAREAGIEVTVACTLVMLSIGAY